ncbi:serine/threonine protein phosphatase [Paenibacillaceae bacterium]|nr:serine/threonine protein phosphatase [Paenibacillaceae bacterium]
MGRILAVSDIHGYSFLLERLLHFAGYNSAEDHLYLLGDYVNKGPDSKGTLQLVERLCREGAIALQGNNERKWLLEMPVDAVSGSVEAARCRSMIACLPLWAKHGRYLFVHAGLRPGVGLKEQSAEDLTNIREEFHQSPAMKGITVVFGHTSTFRFGTSPDCVWQGEGKLGIDTGAGHGRYLSLIDLTGNWQWLISVTDPTEMRKQRLPCPFFV